MKRENPEAAHAPLPWRVCPTDPFWIEDANQNDVADTNCANVTAPDEANAAFIVRACNSYNTLLDACERTLNALLNGQARGDESTVILLRAAITAATSSAEPLTPLTRTEEYDEASNRG